MIIHTDTSYNNHELAEMSYNYLNLIFSKERFLLPLTYLAAMQSCFYLQLTLLILIRCQQIHSWGACRKHHRNMTLAVWRVIFNFFDFLLQLCSRSSRASGWTNGTLRLAKDDNSSATAMASLAKLPDHGTVNSLGQVCMKADWVKKDPKLHRWHSLCVAHSCNEHFHLPCYCHIEKDVFPNSLTLVASSTNKMSVILLGFGWFLFQILWHHVCAWCFI